MIYLEDFFKSFSHSQKLLEIARAIQVRVLRIRIDSEAKGLELSLDLLGTVPDGELLVELEKAMQSELSLSRVRLFLSGFPQENVAAATRIYPLLPWILYALKRENPLIGSLVSNAVFEDSQKVLTGHLNHSLDTVLENEFANHFELFVQKYLEIHCPFVWEYNNFAKTAAHEAMALEQAEILRREVHEALILSSQAGSPAEESVHSINPNANSRFGMKGSAKAKPSQPKPKSAKVRDDLPEVGDNHNGQEFMQPNAVNLDPPAINQDSWEYRAKEAAKENKTVFTRMPKADGIFWGKGNPTLPVVKIQDMNANTGLVQFDGKVEIDTFNLTKTGNKVRINFYVTDDTGCISCVYFMLPKREWIWHLLSVLSFTVIRK